MKLLNLLLIFLLIVFLGIGGYTIYTVNKFYTNDFVPHKILMNHVFPFELFEAACLAATVFCVIKFRKGDYKLGVYVGFTVVILCSLFFSFV